MESRYNVQTGTLYVVRTDECPEDPHTDLSVWGFVFFHKRCDLPNDLDVRSGDFNGWDELEAYIRERMGETTEIEPVFMYNHSWTAFSRSLTCPWDSGQVGFAYRVPSDTPDLTREKALGYLDEELEEYTNYANGNVLELVVTEKGEDPEYSTFYTEKALKAYLEAEVPGYAEALPLKKAPSDDYALGSRALTFIKEKGLMPEYLKWLTE